MDVSAFIQNSGNKFPKRVYSLENITFLTFLDLYKHSFDAILKPLFYFFYFYYLFLLFLSFYCSSQTQSTMLESIFGFASETQQSSLMTKYFFVKFPKHLKHQNYIIIIEQDCKHFKCAILQIIKHNNVNERHYLAYTR